MWSPRGSTPPAAPWLPRGHSLRGHTAFVETFNTLTSGKIKPRPSAAAVAKALRSSIRPRATLLHLSGDQLFDVIDQSESRGVRGGAIFDYLHLVTARHHKADRFYTLNTSHFESFWREGDPSLRTLDQTTAHLKAP